MRFTWGATYALFWIYRSIFSFLGQTIVLRLTSVPDTAGYQAFGYSQLGGLLAGGPGIVETGPLMQQNATMITQIVGGVFHILFGGNAVLINIGFQSVAFVGLVYLLQGLESARTRAFVLLLAMTPSFTVWSSIASKEAIVVFLCCVLARYVVDIHHNRDRLTFLRFAALSLTLGVLYIFKPHFLPAFLFVIGTSKIARHVRQPATITLLSAAASIFALYLVRDRVDQFARLVSGWVSVEPGNSSRAEAFIVHQYEVFTKAPEGMLRAFVGPTWNEAAEGGLALISYIESVGILVALAIFVAWRLPRMPVYSATIALFTLFWTMFANYPLGVMNPGTAVRYRTDYIVLIFLAVAVLTSRDMYVRWRTGESRRKGKPSPRVAAFRPATARA